MPVPDPEQVSIAQPLIWYGCATGPLLDGRSKNTSGFVHPACVMVSDCPPIVIVPVRGCPVVLGAIVMPMLSGPVPLARWNVIPDTSLCAVHPQRSGSAMTSMRQSLAPFGDSRGGGDVKLPARKLNA